MKLQQRSTIERIFLDIVESHRTTEGSTETDHGEIILCPMANGRHAPAIRNTPKLDGNFFRTVEAILRQPGDFVIASRTNAGTIRLIAGNDRNAAREKTPAETFNDFTLDIRSVETFMKVWREYLGHFIGHAEGLMAAINAVAASGTTDLEAQEFEAGPRTVELTEPLLPALAALQSFFNFIPGFSINPHVGNSWECDLIRSQKHHIVGSFTASINFKGFYEEGEECLTWLVPLIAMEFKRFFDPMVYIEGLNAHELFRRRFRISFPEKSPVPIEPTDGVKLIRTLNELFLEIGRTAVEKPHEIDLSYDAGTLSLTSAGSAFGIYEEGSPARDAVTDIYGADNIEFVPDDTDGAVAQIDLAVTNFVPFATPAFAPVL